MNDALAVFLCVVAALVCFFLMAKTRATKKIQVYRYGGKLDLEAGVVRDVAIGPSSSRVCMLVCRQSVGIDRGSLRMDVTLVSHKDKAVYFN